MSKFKRLCGVARNKWNPRNDDVMICIPTVGNFSFYCVGRNFSDNTPSTNGDSWGSKECKIIIGAPTFNESKRGGNPDTSKDFKFCWKFNSSGTESKDLYCTPHQATALYTKVVLMVQVVLLRGANMQRSDNHVMFA